MPAGYGRFRRGDNSLDTEGRDIAKIDALESIARSLKEIVKLMETKDANSK